NWWRYNPLPVHEFVPPDFAKDTGKLFLESSPFVSFCWRRYFPLDTFCSFCDSAAIVQCSFVSPSSAATSSTSPSGDEQTQQSLEYPGLAPARRSGLAQIELVAQGGSACHFLSLVYWFALSLVHRGHPAASRRLDLQRPTDVPLTPWHRPRFPRGSRRFLEVPCACARSGCQPLSHVNFPQKCFQKESSRSRSRQNSL